MNTAKAPTRIGILGCGQVAHEYTATINSSPTAVVTACADARPGVAEGFAVRHGIDTPATVDQLLDGVVDIVVILTPPHTHAELGHRAIAAGVPGLYIEKPLAPDHTEAASLLAAAEAAGTRLGAAPDTVLGQPAHTAAAAIADGLIGEIHSANAAYQTSGPERWHPAPEPFYTAGVGPLVDMGTYYLTMLVHLLGPITTVLATSTVTRPRRMIATGPRAGTGFTAHAPTYISTLLRAKGQVPVSFIASFDSAGSRSPHLEIHGGAGTLLLPDPNFHDGEVLLRLAGSREWARVLANPRSPWPAARGVGVLELVAVLAGDQSDHICSGSTAAHVTAVIDGIRRAADIGETAIPPDAALSQFRVHPEQGIEADHP